MALESTVCTLQRKAGWCGRVFGWFDAFAFCGSMADRASICGTFVLGGSRTKCQECFSRGFFWLAGLLGRAFILVATIFFAEFWLVCLGYHAAFVGD
jgi:hypothetical protein